MAEDLIMDSIENPEPEVVLDKSEKSPYQPLLDRLEILKTLPTQTATLKKQMWLQSLTLWSDILQLSPSDAQSCYVECANVLPRVMKAVNFYFIRKDLNVARTSCFTCITLLNHPNMRHFLQLTTEQQDLPENKHYCKHVYHLLLISANTISYLPFSTVDDRQFIENHVELYQLLIQRIEQSIFEHCQTAEEQQVGLSVIELRILSLIWNTADRTILIPLLLKCDLVKNVIGWLSQAAKLKSASQRSLISIVHNIARHDDGADELNKLGAIEIIKRYRNIKVTAVDSRILITSMTLALLSTPEELKNDKKGMNTVLNQLLQLVIDAAKSDRYRKGGFHVSESLCVLVKMFVVEERTIEYVLCHAETRPPSTINSTIHLFASLLFKFADALNGTDLLEQFTLTALLNIFWSISFQKSYTSILIEDQDFIVTIQKLFNNNDRKEVLEQYKPRSMEGVKEAVHGILHNLNLDNKHELIVDQSSNVTHDDVISSKKARIQKKPSIMISYSHSDNPFCSQVFDLLNKYSDTFEIWIDRTHCQGVEDLWESIADGMEQASIIVCLLSSQYFESKSCRKEFIYATDSLKKKMLPILIERFEPKGWLGIRMTGIKYVRFRGPFDSEPSKITELVNTIRSSLSTTISPTDDNRSKQLSTSNNLVPLSSTMNTSVPQLTHINNSCPVNEWTTTNGEIQAWFSQNQLSVQFRDLFNFQTGEEMLSYAQMLMKDPEQHMHTYSRIYATKYNGDDMPPHEFNRFMNSLEKLRRDNPLSSIQTNQSNSNRSSTCIIL